MTLSATLTGTLTSLDTLLNLSTNAKNYFLDTLSNKFCTISITASGNFSYKDPDAFSTEILVSSTRELKFISKANLLNTLFKGSGVTIYIELN